MSGTQREFTADAARLRAKIAEREAEIAAMPWQGRMFTGKGMFDRMRRFDTLRNQITLLRRALERVDG